MRYRMLVVLAALAALAAGCLPAPALYPLVDRGHRLVVPGIVGTWGDSNSFRFEQHPDSTYTMSALGASDSAVRYDVQFARFGGRLFADMKVDDRSLPVGNPAPALWPMHLIFRVDLAGDSLRMAFLDDEWVEKALARRKLKLRCETPEGGILLTEKTRGLQSAMRRIARVDSAFDVTARFERRR